MLLPLPSGSRHHSIHRTIAAAATALALQALRRLRFARDPAAPGLIEVDEAQITYLSSLGGGAVSLAELAEIRAMHFEMMAAYTRRDLPQQLLQLDYLTPELYNRMSPVKRYLMEIEPPRPGDGILRQPKKDHKGWWN